MRKCPLRSSTFVAVGLALVLTGCAGDPLDYETALNLLRERTLDPVKTSFSASPQFDRQPPAVSEAYQRLINEHVIVCNKKLAVGTFCEPGPAGDALLQEGVSQLSLVTGRWVPSTILAIRRTGRNRATADVRMSFEPSQIFQDFGDAFDQIQGLGRSLTLANTRQQGKTVQATFQRDADGWHVEAVD
jgi:hypothetical protein